MSSRKKAILHKHLSGTGIIFLSIMQTIRSPINSAEYAYEEDWDEPYVLNYVWGHTDTDTFDGERYYIEDDTIDLLTISDLIQ